MKRKRRKSLRKHWGRQQMLNYIIDHNSLYLLVNLSGYKKDRLKRILRRIDREKKRSKRAA